MESGECWVLAGLALLRLNPTQKAAEELSREATVKAPSFLTPRIQKEIRLICQKAAISFDHEKYEELWRTEERARAAIQRHGGRGLRTHEGEIYWIKGKQHHTFVVSKPQGQHFSFAESHLVEDGPGHDRSILRALEQAKKSAPKPKVVRPPNVVSWEVSGPEEFESALANYLSEREAGGNRWIGVAIRMGSSKIGDAGEVLAMQSFAGGMTLEIGVVDPLALEAGLAEQRQWVLWMIGLALLAVGAGLWFMLRG